MYKHALENDDMKIEILRLANEGLSSSQIEDVTGVGKSAIQRFLRKETYKSWWNEVGGKPIAGGEVHDHHDNLRKLSGNRFILTSAQNSTFCHLGFLKSLEVAAEYLNAQIIVGTFSYNKSAFQNLEKGDGEWFDPAIVDYIIDEPVLLADDLLWCGELNILPTAVNPLSGLHSYTKARSGIVPHAKVQLESLPTHKTKQARMMYTTGAVTKRNYIQKKSGQKASFHHVFGALLVEIDAEGDWFARQLIADSKTGEFQDLDVLYTPNGIQEGVRVEAINWGDIHAEKYDPVVYEASFYNTGRSMLDVLKPKYQFVHDCLDMEARSHHNIKDPYFRFDMYKRGRELVQDNVNQVSKVLEIMQRDYCDTIVVESNHDLALKRWLRESDYKSDPANAIFFLECQLAMYYAIDMGKAENFSILEHLVLGQGVKAKFLKTDESFVICDRGDGGIECGAHGHLGINGSRGSIGAYQKLDARYNIGHSHSAAIKDGVYQAGISADINKMDYAKGPSSWSHSHIVTYPNGKRAIVTLKNGKWRA